MHCIPPLSGAMQFRCRQTVSGKYSHFPQLSNKFKRVPQAIFPGKTVIFQVTTRSNSINSNFPGNNNSQGSILSKKKTQDDRNFTRGTCTTQNALCGDPALYRLPATLAYPLLSLTPDCKRDSLCDQTDIVGFGSPRPAHRIESQNLVNILFRIRNQHFRAALSAILEFRNFN